MRPGRQVAVRSAWVAHWRACASCQSGPELCPAGVGLASVVLETMQYGESLCCLVPQ